MRVSIDWVIESYLTLVPQNFRLCFPRSVGSSLGMELDIISLSFPGHSVRVQPRKHIIHKVA